MAWKWYDGVLIKFEDISPTARHFWIEVEKPIDFIAGQFVTMDLPIGDKRLNRWRSYSIANPPNESNVLEFCIVNLKGGGASNYLFNQVEEGTKIRFKGPSGAFLLPEEIDKDIVMVCTGTGVAPFRSMIGDIINKNKPHQKIHLIFGTRYQEGILYQSDFKSLAEKHDWFSYDVTLSRQIGWGGHTGYVHDIYMEQYGEVNPGVWFYLCGWTNMVDEAVEKLILELGYEKSQIKYELYG